MAELSASKGSVASNLFLELDQIQETQAKWNEEQESRERIFRELQLQYQSLKSSM